MKASGFEILVLAVGVGFAAVFFTFVAPPAFASGDIIAAFAAGFVNPFASGYAMDAIACGLILAIWIVHDARRGAVRHGWLILPLIIAPGVATAFAIYLVMRFRQRER
ncbi:MAG: DUF2834 domain-containing protein [Pseudomonadota bacterium]